MRCFILALAVALAMPSVAGAAAHEKYTVHIKDFAYKATPLHVAVGDTVTFINDDQEAHTVTSTGKVFDSTGLDTGDSWTYTFKKPGKFAYFCTLHPWMKGSVIVGAGSKS